MNKLKNLFCLGLALLLTMGVTRGATWSDAVGIGTAGDQAFSGSGVPMAVIQSVLSNNVYYIASARGDGAPLVKQLLVKPDLTGFNLDFLQGTNVWICASNQPAGTNQIWLSTTNAGLATNDLLVLHNVASDSYQLLVLSGNATDAAGLVATNALGQCLIKVFTTPTNTITAQDKIYKMARTLRLNPLSDHVITNAVISPWGNWLSVNKLVADQPLNFSGRANWPLVVMATGSNAVSLYVAGEYYRRPRF